MVSMFDGFLNDRVVQVSIYAAIVFYIVAHPETFKFVDSTLGLGGKDKGTLLLVHSVVVAVLMYFGTKMLENFGLDDVVGAIPVHMFAGIFGTLVVPLTNGDTSFATQFIGVISVCIFSFILSYGVFKALSMTIGLRISKEAEKLGTDKAEIGVVAYSIRD